MKHDLRMNHHIHLHRFQNPFNFSKPSGWSSERRGKPPPPPPSTPSPQYTNPSPIGSSTSRTSADFDAPIPTSGRRSTSSARYLIGEHVRSSNGVPCEVVAIEPAAIGWKYRLRDRTTGKMFREGEWQGEERVGSEWLEE